jgi:hypothetical protein
MTNISTSPCFRCSQRAPACHSDCGQYLSYRALCDKATHNRYEQGKIDEEVLRFREMVFMRSGRGVR